MHPVRRLSLALIALAAFAERAYADDAAPTPPDMPSAPSASALTAQNTPAPAPADSKKPKEPKRGDFNAGGQVRMPNGPDEMGQYASFNWVAVDLQGRYYLLDFLSVYGTAPVALIHPDDAMGSDPKTFGGMMVTLDAKLPKGPFTPKKYEADVGLLLSGSYMTEGAMLLSQKDFPLFAGDYQPGWSAGVRAKVKLSSLVDFSLTPLYVFQKGDAESLTAIQVPTSLILRLGSLIQLSADTGIYTGDDFALSGDDGGRIALGGSLTVKIGKIQTHVGAGAASLLTGGLYPSVRDSVYLDLDVKFVK